MREEPGGKPFEWEAAEMISPVTDSVTRALHSDAYAEAVRKVRDATRFVLSAGPERS